MPIYVIECTKCKHTEEKLFHWYNDLYSYDCPNCGESDWIKKPCNTNWAFGKQSIQKQSMIEMGDIKGI